MFRVSYERKEGLFLRGLHFPEGAKTIPSEGEAWNLAEAFAKSEKGRVVNVYVTDSNHHPVKGYEARMIRNR